MRTGQSWFDPAGTRVRTYPVTVENTAARMERGLRIAAHGAYVARQYDVTIERGMGGRPSGARARSEMGARP